MFFWVEIQIMYSFMQVANKEENNTNIKEFSQWNNKFLWAKQNLVLDL